jgi:hypothetical protein
LKIILILTLTVMEEKLNVDWETFEEKFNILRDDVIRVPNIFRCICKL